MAGNNGDDSNGIPKEQTGLAHAITQGISDALAPRFAAIEQILNQINTNVQNLQAGAVGVGRFTALEERVTALEKKTKS